MSKTVNMTDIVDYTAYVCRQPRPVTHSACQVMLAHIAEHLSRGHSVQLSGFGRFTAVKSKNGQTVQFKPSKKLLSHTASEDPTQDDPAQDDPNWPFSDWTVGGQ